VAVVDEAGTGFSAPPSDPNVDSPVVSGVGCVVSPRGSQGWLDPAHASVVAPGKRPRLTPAPAMAFTGGKLLMPFGTPGGDVQQQAMLQVFLNTTVWGMPLQEAIEAPRVASPRARPPPPPGRMGARRAGSRWGGACRRARATGSPRSATRSASGPTGSGARAPSAA